MERVWTPEGRIVRSIISRSCLLIIIMQLLIVACALLGVAIGQYHPGFPGYAGYTGYPGYYGYGGYPGFRGIAPYQGFPGYAGYPGYPGYQGYQGYPGYHAHEAYRYQQAALPKPVVPKLKDVTKVVPVVPKPVVPVVPVTPYATKGVPNAGYPAIRSQAQDSSPDGSYSWSYETENGIAAAESGSPTVDADGPAEVVHGSYAYTAPDGTPISVRYTADKNGFHPEGAHLP